MYHLPPPVIRRTSSSTGLSYIYSGDISNAPRKLFICCHGWACAASDYASLLSALAGLNASPSESILFIAVDFPGHGNSAKSICPQPTVPGFASLANDLRREFSPPGELLDTVLVGHSMGCRIALEAFAQEKLNVSGVVLIDGSWVGRSLEVHAAPVLNDREKEIRRISDRIGMYGPLTPESFKDEMQRRLWEIDLEYEYELSRTYIHWDRERMEVVLDELADINPPVEVLAIQSTQGRGANRRPLKSGEEGPWLPFIREKVGSERLQIVVLEGCGHWPHIDKVDEVTLIISGFAGAAKG